MKQLQYLVLIFLLVCTSAKGQNNDVSISDSLFKKAKSMCLTIWKEMKLPKSSLSYSKHKNPALDLALIESERKKSSITKKNLLDLTQCVDSLVFEGDMEEVLSRKKTLDSFLTNPLYDCDYYFQNNKLKLVLTGKDCYLHFECEARE